MTLVWISAERKRPLIIYNQPEFVRTHRVYHEFPLEKYCDSDEFKDNKCGDVSLFSSQIFGKGINDLGDEFDGEMEGKKGG